ncbi:MAG: 2-isopropylmalate synthase [Dehalococcoidia bacterium]|mgnify:CR=1 FL=1|nr:2-isopropylmalate synthase [Dehalococcoidia bacterium]|tara:strand:- start:8581 stop:10122 length:1542 start_codon:yes stop_codon:yes gene_type:complete
MIEKNQTDKLIVFDTTLRDGEQSAGASLTAQDKFRIASQLQKLNVDIIEAGFAASSPGDFAAVRKIALEIEGPTIATLARAVPSDIDSAIDCLKGAPKPRIHTFLSVSDIHLLHQMKKDRESIMSMAVDAVKRARDSVQDVEFSPMDASRSDPDYLYMMLEKAIDAGATTVNIPDTVGYTNPKEFGDLISGVFKNVTNINRAIVSVHCHNDLGMAVANSLSAIENGARQIEGCINGLGERAGNAALEEVIMAVKTRQDHYGVETDINTPEIGPSSRLISNIFGFPIQFNKAITGQNAFRHSSGIHQDAFLKERTTFEIMHPEEVGWKGDAIVLSKLSGRAGLKSRLEHLGFKLSDDELLDVFNNFKNLADQKREITDKDLESLMSEFHRELDTTENFKVIDLDVICGNKRDPIANITLELPSGKTVKSSKTGTGPVDAVCNTIDDLTKMDVNLTEYSVSSVTEGIDALGEVTIRIEKDGTIYTGQGSDTDIILASAKAYVNAINRYLIIKSVN